MPGNEPLALRDIHLPSGIAWWPPALGWWLILLTVLLIIVAGVLFYRYRKSRKLHKAALNELENIQKTYKQNQNDQQLVQSLSIWLRRVCLSFYPRMEVAGLTGKDWIEFLDHATLKPSAQQYFSEDPGTVLISAPYQRPETQWPAPVDANALLTTCRNWITALPRKQSLHKKKTT